MSDTEEIKRLLAQEENVEDDTELEEDVAPSRYDIASYGIDFDVEGLVRRLKRDDIFIPKFQRDFVWKLPESSRFIESLLLGLPVPGVFLAQDPDSGKMLVIDGQQRLLSLKYFYDGYFNPKEDSKTKRVFKLNKVQKSFEGRTYDTLDARDRINLDNCVIHATIVKQESPANDDTSIFHIFERLNSGGRKLTPQEIRSAVYHGKLIELARQLNDYSSWRAIFGPKNDRMKDQELILRFFAMLETSNEYKKPMNEFINIYCAHNKNPDIMRYQYLGDIFCKVTDLFIRAIPERLFRPTRALNVALFECCMVALAKIVLTNVDIDIQRINSAYKSVVENQRILELISQSTSDVQNVTERIAIATSLFERFNNV